LSPALLVLNCLFQSAPHFGSEANHCPATRTRVGMDVSIRASLRQRGEPTYRRRGLDLYVRFNPRLTSAARRTRLRTTDLIMPLMFQSAPHFGSEANHLVCVAEDVDSARVSIRASLRQRGEPELSYSSTCLDVRFNPRLTSAARRTAQLGGTGAGTTFVSIRASLRQRGEPIRSGRHAYNTRRFNPRLTSAARRTSRSAAMCPA